MMAAKEAARRAEASESSSRAWRDAAFQRAAEAAENMRARADEAQSAATGAVAESERMLGPVRESVGRVATRVEELERASEQQAQAVVEARDEAGNAGRRAREGAEAAKETMEVCGGGIERLAGEVSDLQAAIGGLKEDSAGASAVRDLETQVGTRASKRSVVAALRGKASVEALEVSEAGLRARLEGTEARLLGLEGAMENRAAEEAKRAADEEAVLR